MHTNNPNENLYNFSHVRYACARAREHVRECPSDATKMRFEVQVGETKRVLDHVEYFWSRVTCGYVRSMHYRDANEKEMSQASTEQLESNASAIIFYRRRYLFSRASARERPSRKRVFSE
jgi:hypothetical protein